MYKKISALSIAVLFSFCIKLTACSIFTAAKKGVVLAAGNEDWSDPFSKMWVSPPTKDRYGSINFGHSDFQCQTAINEFGLFYDYAAIAKATGKLMAQKQAYDGDLLFDILGKCKNIEEALVYLKKYQFASAYCQVLIGDASGKSLIVSQDILLESPTDYQITTNFNACEINARNYDCKRYQILDEALSSATEISVPFFRNLLSRVHQEGSYPSQYSYVFDLKNGQIHLYSFHNFVQAISLDIKTVLAKGFQLLDLKSLFPLSFEEEYFRLHHKDSLKQNLIQAIKTENAKTILQRFQDYQKNNPSSNLKQDHFLWELCIGSLQEAWVSDSQGMPFIYWWQTQKYVHWKSKNPVLPKLFAIFNYLETIPKDDPKKNIGIYEMKGLLLFIQNQNDQAKTYFEKTVALADKESGNHQRATVFLDHINK